MSRCIRGRIIGPAAAIRKLRIVFAAFAILDLGAVPVFHRREERQPTDFVLDDLLSPAQIDWSIQPTHRRLMREIQASEAKTHFPQLLDEVERGETVVITRHGRPIARIVPEAQRRREQIDQAIENIKALRRRTGKITVEQLLSAKHEGHRH